MRAAYFLLFALLAPIMATEVEVNDLSAFPIMHQPRLFEKEIIAFLECVRELLKKGDDETGLPILDPLNIPTLDIDLDKLELQGLTGTFSLKDFHLAGVAGWKLEQLKISPSIFPIGIKINVKVEWPQGDVSGSYASALSIFGHSAVGDGNISGDLAKLRFELEAQIITNPISVKSVKFVPSLSSSRLEIDNLTIDGHDISGPLADLAAQLPTILKENKALIEKLIKDVIIPGLNAIINGILHPNTKMLNYDIPIIGKCLKPTA